MYAWGGDDGVTLGKSKLLIARSCAGRETTYGRPRKWAWNHPLYLSGRCINKLTMRTPKEIDHRFDGLWQCLKARRVFISREAFFDLTAKFRDREEGEAGPGGWAFTRENEIFSKRLQELAEEFPLDRNAEFEAAREMPMTVEQRIEWARNKRR